MRLLTARWKAGHHVRKSITHDIMLERLSALAQTCNASSCQDIIGVDYLSDVSSAESSQASNSFLSLSENNSFSDETLEDCFQEIKLKRLEHP